MENVFHFKIARRLFLSLLSIILCTSCSNDDYQYAIPSTVTALVKFDISRMKGTHEALKGFKIAEKLKDAGVDWTKTVYGFETIDGNFGICMKVDDSGDLKDAFDKMSCEGQCGKVRKQGDFFFTDIDNSWAVGFSKKSLLIVGPVSAASLTDTQHGMLRMLRQDEDASVIVSPIYAKLDSMESAVAMVAQIQSLPEKFVAPFTIGAPKEADASQILVAVNFSMDKGVVIMDGETFSFNKSIDSYLKKANATYRSIKGDFSAKVPSDFSFGFMANFDGRKYLPLLQSDKSMQTLLAGLNTAIDFDNIIKSVNGDMLLTTSGMFDNNFDMTMLAKVTQPSWTADIGYWKQSCPSGSSITGTDGKWIYKDNHMTFAFGLAAGTFYGTTNVAMIPADKVTYNTIDSNFQNIMKNGRMVVFMNIGKLSSGESLLPNGVNGLVKKLLGNTKYAIYILK